jgi:hypothetical protein
MLTTASSVHNAYMLASAWRIVCDMIDELDEGIEDKFMRNRLASDEDYRTRYLMMLDFVTTIVDLGLAQFQVLVAATRAYPLHHLILSCLQLIIVPAHYQKYFRDATGGDPDAPDYQFDFTYLKDVYKSFLDSIIVELCLPQTAVPKRILFQILHEAVDEAPREAKRFPQTVWDAAGDLGVCASSPFQWNQRHLNNCDR